MSSLSIHVLAMVDVDDIDEVLDHYLYRLAQLQVEEGLPLSVIPMQAPVRLSWLLAEHPASS